MVSDPRPVDRSSSPMPDDRTGEDLLRKIDELEKELAKAEAAAVNDAHPSPRNGSSVANVNSSASKMPASQSQPDNGHEISTRRQVSQSPTGQSAAYCFDCHLAHVGGSGCASDVDVDAENWPRLFASLSSLEFDPTEVLSGMSNSYVDCLRHLKMLDDDFSGKFDAFSRRRDSFMLDMLEALGRCGLGKYVEELSPFYVVANAQTHLFISQLRDILVTFFDRDVCRPVWHAIAKEPRPLGLFIESQRRFVVNYIVAAEENGYLPLPSKAELTQAVDRVFTKIRDLFERHIDFKESFLNMIANHLTHGSEDLQAISLLPLCLMVAYDCLLELELTGDDELSAVFPDITEIHHGILPAYQEYMAETPAPASGSLVDNDTYGGVVERVSDVDEVSESAISDTRIVSKRNDDRLDARPDDRRKRARFTQDQVGPVRGEAGPEAQFSGEPQETTPTPEQDDVMEDDNVAIDDSIDDLQVMEADHAAPSRADRFRSLLYLAFNASEDEEAALAKSLADLFRKPILNSLRSVSVWTNTATKLPRSMVRLTSAGEHAL
ncbi:uncharacterized protein AB675_7451 [Cyphellophora attinorum]|uniref:Uncharacterized protein n=1 Tax=Cyphellophora attinorum TaxID=1664694 RepID=A0A0N1NZG5_9EURO|nr:uncharacterized protein AB675_7451 [Phialophora attinorum]KPI40252.1 hypothetical protein AB675_7451 [Phialophora attinorum]